MLEWNSDIDKFSFIRLFFYKMERLINTEWDKENNDGKTHIVVKFSSLNHMMKAKKRFNNTAAEVKSIMRLKSKRYFKFGSKWISSREFKILNVPANIKDKCIETAIRHIMHGKPFYVKKGRSQNNDVTFTLKNDHACNMLKDVWAININNTIFQLTPSFFQRSHLEYRNQHIGKF